MHSAILGHPRVVMTKREGYKRLSSLTATVQQLKRVPVAGLSPIGAMPMGTTGGEGRLKVAHEPTATATLSRPKAGHGDGLGVSVSERTGLELNHLDALTWGLSRAGDGLESLSAFVSRAPHDPVTVETLIADQAPPLETLAALLPNAEAKQAGMVALLRIDHADGPFVISAWPTAFEGVFHLVGSVPSTDPRWQKVERLISRATPWLVPCFLNHGDFADVGTALSEHGDVEVSRLTARRRADVSSLTRGWQQRSGVARPNHLQAISDAEAEGASVRTLTLQVGSAEAPVLSVHLRRMAGATYYGGDFSVFVRTVLGRLATAAARRAALLNGRQRAVRQPLPAPISIRLPNASLTNAEATADVVREVARQSAIGVAVLHRNPYLHMVVTDYTDGSNFDVTVTTSDSIQVFPGFRASMGALARLTQRLGERFGALEIAEAHQEPAVSLDDLVANA